MTTQDPQSGPPAEGATPAGGPPPPPAPPPAPGGAAQTAPPSGPAPTGESNAAAVTSLIFGILSWVCLGPLAAIVAIITGVIGRKKTYQRGMATAGLWLGIVNLVLGVILGIVFLIMAIAGIGFLAESTKVADPSDYQVTINKCFISPNEAPSAEFTITNETSEEKSFTVTIRFESATSSESAEQSTTITSIPAGATRAAEITAFDTFSSSAQRGECSLEEVRNFFN